MTASERTHRSIGEVLAEVQDEFPDITISKIRFLESQGLIDPERTQAGYRKFYEHDIERLRFILRSQKDAYLPLKVIRDRLDSATGQTAVIPDRVDITEPVPIVSVAVTPTTNEERVPIWMLDRPARPAPEAPPAPVAALVTPASIAALNTSEVSLTAAELESAAGITSTLRLELESYRLIAPRMVAGDQVYGDDALIVARTAAAFAQLGIEPRHLRMYKSAAEKEAAAYEQLVLPLLKQRNPQARADAASRLKSLIELGERMRAALVAGLLRQVGER